MFMIIFVGWGGGQGMGGEEKGGGGETEDPKSGILPNSDNSLTDISSPPPPSNCFLMYSFITGNKQDFHEESQLVEFPRHKTRKP